MDSRDETIYWQKLQQAGTTEERVAAIEAAVKAGVSLTAIQEYLDWLDHHPPELPVADDSSDNPRPIP